MPYQQQKGAGKKTAPGQDRKQVVGAHDTGVRDHFNDRDMDFNLGTIVPGAAVNHGVEIGAACYAAS